jgi:site-specific DNA-cytosine methylase
MLEAIDLFSGISGVSHALRSVITPIAFVEKDPECRDFIAKKHPGVPIHDDVLTYHPPKASIVLAGFPCQGFSTAGLGTGFCHEGSKLFFEVVRIAEEAQVDYVFIENSHVLSMEQHIRVVVDSFPGYDCRWLVCRATAVGAPHERHRIFFLGIRRGVTIDITIPDVQKFDWTQNEPDRQVETPVSFNKRNIGWLGNSIVPDQIRYAFATLLTIETQLPTNVITQGKTWHPNGISNNGEITTFKMSHPTREPVNITITPRDNEKSFRLNGNETKIMTTGRVKRYWATPLRSFMKETKATRTLTTRTIHALATQVAFAGGNLQWHLNWEFCAWLMGYPVEYFDV